MDPRFYLKIGVPTFVEWGSWGLKGPRRCRGPEKNDRVERNDSGKGHNVCFGT